MKNIPIAIKFICNTLFFLIYCFIGIMAVSFLYWFILTKILGWSVPGSADPIHLKLAFFSILVITVLTVVFRKFFYISCMKEQSQNTLPTDTTKEWN